MAESALSKSTRFRSLAIVSGKGGSGKTLVAASLAQLLAAEGKRVVLIDADLGTGGLTYYLAFSAFERAREGFAEYLLGRSTSIPKVARPKSDLTSQFTYMGRVSLLPIGEHRIYQGRDSHIDADKITKLNSRLKVDFDVAIFDCRGGIDHDSTAVCSAVDDVLLIAETDAAAIQASQYLSNRLYDIGLGQRIIGFALNKAMDDPTSLAKAGTTFFRAEFLGAIPFDIETTRSFIKGDLPGIKSVFSQHVGAAVLPALGISGVRSKYRTFTPREFSESSLRNPNEYYGSISMAILIAYVIGANLLVRFAIPKAYIGYQDIFSAVFAALAVISLSNEFKRSIGRVAAGYARAFQSLFGGRSRAVG